MEIRYFESLNRMLPEYYDNIVEMRELLLSEDKMYKQTVEIFNVAHQGQYIPTMNASFIKGMEGMLGISSNNAESLEFRRSRVLNRLSVKVPFNEDFLKRKLDTIYGGGNYVLSIGSGISIFDQVPINGYRKGDIWYWQGEDFPGRNLILGSNKFSRGVGDTSITGSVTPEDLTNGKSSGYFIATKDSDTFDFNDWEYHGQTISQDILDKIEEQRFEINLETTVIDSNWYKEGYLTIQQMKPANMVYIHKPLLFENLSIEENIYKADGVRFRVGISKVGIDPLLRMGEYEEVKTV